MQKSNEKGFLLVEMLICLALTTMMIGVCLPIVNQLKVEQKVIAHRTDIYHYLYNHIQIVDANDLPFSYTTSLDMITLNIKFYFEEDLIVGEGDWLNAKNQSEQALVYFKR